MTLLVANKLLPLENLTRDIIFLINPTTNSLCLITDPVSLYIQKYKLIHQKSYVYCYCSNE